MKQLDEERFPKLMAYLANPVSRRARTNNHVERTNRMFRRSDCGSGDRARPAEADLVERNKRPSLVLEGVVRPANAYGSTGSGEPIQGDRFGDEGPEDTDGNPLSCTWRLDASAPDHLERS